MAPPIAERFGERENGGKLALSRAARRLRCEAVEARVVDPVLLLALGSLSGAAFVLAPLATMLAAIGIAIALRRKAKRAAILASFVALAIAAWRARAATDRAEASYRAALALARPPARCEAIADVVSSPVVLRQGAAARRDAAEALSDPSRGDARADFLLVSGACDDRSIDAPIRARISGAPASLARGDRVHIVADLAVVHRFQNDGVLEARARLARSGAMLSGGALEVRVVEERRSVAWLIDRARARVRERIEATYAPEASALGRALVLGEADLDPKDDEAFRVSGLAHLLAVSGTHLVLAVLTFTSAARALLVRVPMLAERFDVARLAALFTIPAAWIYADFAGASGSAERAAAMLTVAMLTRALGRRPSAGRVLGWSLLGASLCDPLVALDISFLLSASATAGLVALKAPIEAALAEFGARIAALFGVKRRSAFDVEEPSPRRRALAWLGGAVATTMAATIGCAPALSILAPTLPILGVAANLVAAPLGELAALPLCLAHVALGFSASLERGAAAAGSGALLAVRAVARASSATGLVLAVPPPTSVEIVVLAIGIAATYAARPSLKRATIAIMAAALVLLEIATARRAHPRGELRVTALDVGQGDAFFVDLPDGRAMLVDGGGLVGSPLDIGVRVVAPFLRERRRRRVDVVVLSHPHPDHFGGLVKGLAGVEVGELWDTGQGEAQDAGEAYAALLADMRARGVPIRRPAELCGERSLGGVNVEVLAPCPSFDPDRGANDNSFVLRLRYGARAALLVGDAERDEEADLLARGADVRADLLKVGHHGSRTSSTPAFLDAVHPSVAFVSAGVRNRFDHPHPATLAALAARHIPLFRTDLDGSFTWSTDGKATFLD